jgi:hypothetical protein
MTINFLVIAGGTSGQANSLGYTSSGGGSGGILQGTLDISANNPIDIVVGGGGTDLLIFWTPVEIYRSFQNLVQLDPALLIIISRIVVQLIFHIIILVCHVHRPIILMALVRVHLVKTDIL